MKKAQGIVPKETVIIKESGATFSSCKRYRYTLWRTWNKNLPYLLCILLNPSTADEINNDPTVERCQRRAISGGYGSLMIGNIFALRSTDPKELYKSVDPVGPDNDRAILDMAKTAKTVVCGWGTHGNLLSRGIRVEKLLAERNVHMFCLGQNTDGTPKHPLYIGYAVDFRPIVFAV